MLKILDNEKETKIIEYLKANEGNLVSARDLKKELHFATFAGRALTKATINRIANDHRVKVKWNTRDKNRDVIEQEKIIINYVREHNESGILMTELKKELQFYLYRGRGVCREMIENLAKRYGIFSVNWKTKFTKPMKNVAAQIKTSSINIVDLENHPSQILIF